MIDRLERGINFRQAQGNEKQCPFVGIIEIGEELAGIKIEERDKFCYLRMNVTKWSEGIPQIPKEYILTPEIACKTVAIELCSQVLEVQHSTSDDKIKEILSRWRKVVSENKDKDIYDFNTNIQETSFLSKKGLCEKVGKFAIKIFFDPQKCILVPQGNNVVDDELI